MTVNPDLDLTISRVIKAPRTAVWRAWADPRSLEQWFVPEPAKCRIPTFELRPGGALQVEYSEDGTAYTTILNGCFLAVDEGERIVLTDTLLGGWRPSERPFMTAVMTFRDHPDGTDYHAHAMHKSPADRQTHETMGFHDGWGKVAAQLARMVEKP